MKAIVYKKYGSPDVLELKEVENPAIDRCFPLSETAEAFRYFGEGHFKGKIVITVEHHTKT